ncbi:hypothetical protein L2E82_48086 [Cichorium intybus]|uniref:Uncharacterized protein n=1 Tax=Cichorium intybus TaxID=13427 RepID=A0ACB8YXE6_CICIN|nr:hypothetical protein L2E82_48086 [Cichorium intybus]
MGGNGVLAAILAGDTFKYYSEGEWKVSSSGNSVPIINPTTRMTRFKVQVNSPIPNWVSMISFFSHKFKKFRSTLSWILTICSRDACNVSTLLSLQIPLGVVLAIPPVNYPVNLAVSKIAPALIAGTPLYSSGQASYSVLLMVKLQYCPKYNGFGLAASNIVKGGFSYSGQRCTTFKVVLVMESIADALVKKFNEKVGKLTVGPPENKCDITPVVTESSANFIECLVMDAKKKGATFCREYKREGNLIWPLLLDNVNQDMIIAWKSRLDLCYRLLGSLMLKKGFIIVMRAILGASGLYIYERHQQSNVVKRHDGDRYGSNKLGTSWRTQPFPFPGFER